MATSIIVLVLLILSGLLGYWLGFGKWLKFISSGILGSILSIAMCFLFGKAIRTSPLIANLLNDYILWIIFYYIVLFFIMQGARMLFVLAIKRVMESKNRIMKFLNRFLGTTLMMAVFCIFVLIILAFVRALPDLSTSKSILEWIDGSVMMDIYNAKIIVF